MKNTKNELLQFVSGVVMLIAGLYILSRKVIVTSYGFGYFSLGGMRVTSGLIIVPLIIGIVWMFVSGASFASKVFSALSVLLIIVSIIMSTNIHLLTMSLYDWILVLVLIFGGGAFVLKFLLAGDGSKKGASSGKGSKQDNESDYVDIDEELERIRKNMK